MTEWIGSSHPQLHSPGRTVWVAKCCDSVMRLWLKNRIFSGRQSLKVWVHRFHLSSVYLEKCLVFLPALNSSTFKHLIPLIIIHKRKVAPNYSSTSFNGIRTTTCSYYHNLYPTTNLFGHIRISFWI